jgi:hypothetical protein
MFFADIKDNFRSFGSGKDINDYRYKYMKSWLSFFCVETSQYLPQYFVVNLSETRMGRDTLNTCLIYGHRK